MNFINTVLVAVFIFSLIIILTVSLKSKHFFKSLFLTAFSGLGTLFALSFVSQFTPITLPVNCFTAAVSTFSGIPGVIALLLTSFTV